MNNLGAIKNDLIARSYPELADINIQTSYSLIFDSFFDFIRYDQKNYLIEANQDMKKADKLVVIGGLTHELSQILRETRMNNFQNAADNLLCSMIPFYRNNLERSADLETIARGYGKELLAFVKHAEKCRNPMSNNPYITFYGLSTGEIRNVLNADTSGHKITY
jgi:hypothetical protein